MCLDSRLFEGEGEGRGTGVESFNGLDAGDDAKSLWKFVRTVVKQHVS